MTKQNRLREKIQRGLAAWGVTRVLHTAPHHDDIMLGYYPLIVRSPETDNHMMYLVSGSNGVSDDYLYSQLGQDHELAKIYLQQGDFTGNSTATLMKMHIRETEAECLWNQSGIKYGISHQRSAFYNGSYFERELNLREDIARCVDVINNFAPELILVLHDSDSHGPPTHHLAYRVIMAAIELYKKPVSVWGYRNVWDRYRLEDAEIIVPVSQAELDLQHQMFISCFASQARAVDCLGDGTLPFSVHAQKIQREQFEEAVALLGKDYFTQHSDPRMRSAVGLILFEKVGK
jgi:hypothetical protein